MNRRATFPAVQSGTHPAPSGNTECRLGAASDTTEWRACDDCSGFGHFRDAIRVAGEWLDGDFGETRCENCDGLGGWEACTWCGKPEAQGCGCYRVQQVADGEAAIARIAEVYRTHRVAVRGRG